MVGRAEDVYVNGEVLRIGGVQLGERDSISILQALSQSGGFTKDAKSDKVRILRPVLTTNRRTVIYVECQGAVRGEGYGRSFVPWRYCLYSPQLRAAVLDNVQYSSVAPAAVYTFPGGTIEHFGTLSLT